MRNFDTNIFISWSSPLKTLAMNLKISFNNRNINAIVGAEEPNRDENSFNDYFPTRILQQLRSETTHGVILLMPDFEDNSRFFFRDNVMFETGFLLAHLPNQSIFCFTIGATEKNVPSNIQGIDIQKIPQLSREDLERNVPNEEILIKACNFISDQVSQKINSSIFNKINLAQPFDMFSKYSYHKSFLRTQIDGLQGPNVTRFASTLLCITTASAYAEESNLIYEWCKDSITQVKTARWQSYIMIAQNILKFYKQSKEMTKNLKAKEFNDLLNSIQTWERAHENCFLNKGSMDSLIYLHSQNYKQHLLRRIAHQRNNVSERKKLLDKAWNCLVGIINVINNDKEYFSAESKWLWLGFAHFQICRCWYDMGLPEENELFARKNISLACDFRMRIDSILENQDSDMIEKRLYQNYKLETVTNQIFRMKHWPSDFEVIEIESICDLLRDNMPDNTFWRRTYSQVHDAISNIICEETVKKNLLNDLNSMVIKTSLD